MTVERRAAAARNGWLATAILIVATAFVTACDDGSDAERAARDGTSERSGVLRLPRALANTRAVDPDRLMAILYIDGLPTVVERDGSGWSASFDLDGPTTLQVSWVYETGTGSYVVARSALIEIEPGDPVRAIVIEDYDTRSFDDDGDGVDNLTEIEAGTDPGTADEGAREFVVTFDVPPSVSSAVSLDSLRPRFDLDGTQTVIQRIGGQWIARFVINDAGTHRLTATWFAEVDGTVLALSRSETVEFTRDSPLSVFADLAYDDSPFDEDDDGESNLSELRGGRDPLSGGPFGTVRPGAGQGDCRALSDELFWEGLDESFLGQSLILEYWESFLGTRPVREEGGDVFAFDDPGIDTLVFSEDGDSPFLYTTLYTERAGTISIDHADGVPEQTVALVFESRVDRGSGEVMNVLGDSGLDEEGRASVTVDVERGIHCYMLIVNGPDSDFRFFGDIVLSVGFTPG